MKLSQKLNEGGLVKIPDKLLAKISTEAKAVMMGQVLYSVESNITQYENISKNLDKENPNYKTIENIVNMLKKYAQTYSKFKAKKSNVRGKKITITQEDMKPYEIEDNFTILLTTSSNINVGGGVTVDNANEVKFRDELPLTVGLGSLINVLKVLNEAAKNASSIFMVARKGEVFDEYMQRRLNSIFPPFKEFQKKIQDAMESSMNYVLKHELVHVIQQQTSQGFDSKAFRKEGGYKAMKSQHTYGEYSTGALEVKAYLESQVNDFFRSVKKTQGKIDYNEKIKSFVKNINWFRHFKDEKQRKTVIRDFTLAVKRDRRYGKQYNESMKIAKKLLNLLEQSFNPLVSFPQFKTIYGFQHWYDKMTINGKKYKGGVVIAGKEYKTVDDALKAKGKQ
jgi:hypothetical protein